MAIEKVSAGLTEYSPSATLSAAINNSTTSITYVSTGDPFTAGEIIKIENEEILIGSINTGTNILTVTRGQRGTTAVAHDLAGVPIYKVNEYTTTSSLVDVPGSLIHIGNYAILNIIIHNYTANAGSFRIFGSNDGVRWIDISGSDQALGTSGTAVTYQTATAHYKSYKVQATHTTTAAAVRVHSVAKG